MSTDLQNPIFHDDQKAREALEAVRWPNGPICPHCGSVERTVRVKGKSHRPGLCYCNECRKQFTVTVGTVFERSKIGLSKWWLAVYLLSSSKKGMSAHQLHRTLGVTYKTAWFMFHRIREAMRDFNMPPMGGEGHSVQADETYFGHRDYWRGKSRSEKKGLAKKRAVFGLLSGGQVRTFHIAAAEAYTVRDLLVSNVRRETELHTDESSLYTRVGREYAAHHTINHSLHEYVKNGITTNAIEGYFSVFKRGMRGTYQHCGEKHLHRYLSEFDFRYNHRSKLGFTDAQRAVIAMKGIEGKRLTYRPIN